MRRRFYILVAILFAGCARDLEFVEPLATDAQDAPVAMSEMRTRALDGAVYNEVVDAWMIPQADPYTLANFQAAYDNLAAGKSAQTLSKAQAAEFAAAKKLAPTHYALKIYPHDEEEQWRVEMTEDVQVAYIPFDWVQLSPEEGEKAAQAKTRSAAANTFAEKSPYTVTYDYTDATDGGPTGPVTYQLPILYTVRLETTAHGLGICCRLRGVPAARRLRFIVERTGNAGTGARGCVARHRPSDSCSGLCIHAECRSLLRPELSYAMGQVTRL